MAANAADPDFEELLHVLHDARGFDYTGYKRPTLMRRVRKRMDAVGSESYGRYREYVEANPGEYAQLFDTILINVTTFFRDPAAWEYVAAEVLPVLLEQKDSRSPIRVWSAGCATGDEAYTIAMLLAEALGEDDLRERVKIYATDVDDDALLTARQAVYTAKQIADVPDELRGRYFQLVGRHVGKQYSFRPDVRRSVIFGRNDLLRDPPISRVDLLISRNTLMYFNRDAQERVLDNFLFALQPRGFLMLGKAESLQRQTGLYRVHDLKNRIFVKDAALNLGPRLRPPPPTEPAPESESDEAWEPQLRDASFEYAPLAQVVVDEAGSVAGINDAARTLFSLRPSDTGRPLRDLDLSYRPLELRSLIEQVRKEQRTITTPDVSWTPGGGTPLQLDVHLSPVFQGGQYAGVIISFADVTRFVQLHGQLERAREDLETAQEELRSTIEELETTNEELQSTNEELETTNEELQSTNEELETMNEELHSTNEELEAMNDELHDRTDEAIRANVFLTSILASVDLGVIVVDPQLHVSAWSRAASEVWGLREDEVRGENFLNLDIGIPTNQLRDPVRGVLRGDEQDAVKLKGHDRRGRSVETEISFSPLLGPLDEIQGAILVLYTERADAQ